MLQLPFRHGSLSKPPAAARNTRGDDGLYNRLSGRDVFVRSVNNFVLFAAHAHFHHVPQTIYTEGKRKMCLKKKFVYCVRGWATFTGRKLGRL